MPELKTRILVVDDDQRLRDLLVRYLGGEGYEVKAVADAAGMDKQLARERYDLIVLDLMLPGEDGLAICRRLRAQANAPAIIMLTAKGDDVDRIVGLEMGADDYLPKPFYPREPRSRELAQQTISTVNLTRAALVSADPFLRRQLLIELNETEGLRVFPATASEKLEPLPDEPLLERVEERVREALGGDTRFASERDGEDGFWVSFFIDEDEFWVMLPWERFEPAFGLQWVGWGLALLAISLAGAWLIASNLSRPLAALTRAA